MADTPNSYKDVYWSTLASNAETKLELPKGILASIVTNGERSNNDQVSEVGAKTPFQITPPTRTLAIKKYGIDPYLSPDNAAEVAGMLLKDSLDRNKGSVAQAIAEYHGGTDRKNWGPKTNAYVARVVGGLKPAESLQEQPSANDGAPVSNDDKVQALQSGFAKWMQDNPGNLNNTPATDSKSVDPKLAKMSEDFAQWAKPNGYYNIPNEFPGGVKPEPAPQADPTLVDKIIGAGEAGLNALTGLTGGTVGLAGGAVKGIGKSVAEGTFGTQQGVRTAANAAAEGAQALTYDPRTQTGQEYANNVGNAMQAVMPVAPLSEIAALGGIAGPTAGAIKNSARQVPAAVSDAAQAAKKLIMRDSEPAASATVGTQGSVGAAGVDIATQRRQAAADLPIPIENLTKGQAERTLEQQRFEGETAKNPELGAPLRERALDHNAKIHQNFDAFIDQTGAQASDLRDVGITVSKALQDKALRDKTEIRVAYKEAEKAGELQMPVPTNNVVKLLNESSSAESVAPVLTAAKKELIRLGGAIDNASGLVAKDISLQNMEMLRRFVNKTIGTDATNIKYGADIKNAIDASTEGLGGDLYKRARMLRTRYANQYENRAVISDLLNTKRGTNDRKVAFEDVFNRTVMQGSVDDLRHLRTVLRLGGEDGNQAWKEIQGQTVQYLKDQAVKNKPLNQRGEAIVSAYGLGKAIEMLDKSDKLNFIFTKQGAAKLRDLNDVVKTIRTTVPSAVNNSDTASVVLAAIDLALSAASGVPAPVTTGTRMIIRHAKDRKLKEKINEALNDSKKGK